MAKSTKMWLLVIMLFAVFFRFWDITNIPPGLYPDEAMNGSNTLEAIETGDYKVFYPENNGREGLFINIQSIFVRFIGAEPWALRLPSAIFGTFTILGIFFLSRILFKNDRLALFASFFTAVSFWHINFSRIGFRAITAPFFLVWGLYFLMRIYHDKGSTKSQTLSAAIGGFLFGLGANSYIAYRITPLIAAIPIIIGFIKFGKKDPSRKSCFPCLAVLYIFFAFAAIIPLLIFFAENPADFFGRTAKISVFSELSPLAKLAFNVLKTIGMFWYHGDFNWRHNFAGEPELFWPVGLFFAVGLFTAIKNLFRKNFNSFFLLAWFFITLLPVVISSEGLPHALRAIISIPAVMIIAAWGLEFTASKIEAWLDVKKIAFPEKILQIERIQWELKVFLLVGLLGVGVNAFNQYFLRWSAKPEVVDAFAENYTNIAKYLNTLPDNLSKYVIVNADGVDVKGIPMPAQPVMFQTKTFLASGQQKRNINYLLPDSIPYDKINNENNAVVVMLENDPLLRKNLLNKIQNLHTEIKGGILVLIK